MHEQKHEKGQNGLGLRGIFSGRSSVEAWLESIDALNATSTTLDLACEQGYTRQFGDKSCASRKLT